MIVQYASDLHLDFTANFRYVLAGGIEPAGDVLVLAGDIVNLFELSRFGEFWDWCEDHFKETIVVPGNHDYYGLWPSLEKLAEPFSISIRPRVRCCNNQTIRISHTDFICSTLWSHVPPQEAVAVADTLLDFKGIVIDGQPLTIEQFNRLHDKSLAFLKKAVQASSDNPEPHDIVVVTHHVPSRLVVHERRKNSPIGSGFVTELGDWIVTTPIDYWVFGHSHDSMEGEIGRTKLVSNQLGYLRMQEGKDFSRVKTFECA